MNIASRLTCYTQRGFSPETAEVNVLIEEALQALFSHFPDTFVFFGGASLGLFYGSQRHSGDLDLLISAKEPPTADELRAVIEPPLKGTAEALGFAAIKIEKARTACEFLKLTVKSDRQLLFTIDLTRISAAVKSEVEAIPLPTDSDSPISINVPSRNLELLFKAEAFLTRKTLKVRDAFDIKFLLDSGALLNENLKAHIADGPAADALESPEFIADRIAQITRQRCQPELKPYLPEPVYQSLDEVDFKPLREAVTRLFSEWL